MHWRLLSGWGICWLRHRAGGRTTLLGEWVEDVLLVLGSKEPLWLAVGDTPGVRAQTRVVRGNILGGSHRSRLVVHIKGGHWHRAVSFSLLLSYRGWSFPLTLVSLLQLGLAADAEVLVGLVLGQLLLGSVDVVS